MYTIESINLCFRSVDGFPFTQTAEDIQKETLLFTKPQALIFHFPLFTVQSLGYVALHESYFLATVPLQPR